MPVLCSGIPVRSFYRSDSGIYGIPNMLRQEKNYKKNKHALFESALIKKDGTSIPVEVNGHIFEINGQKVSLSMARDIAERKAAEKENAELREQLHQSEKLCAVGELAGGIAQICSAPFPDMRI